jgi:hypothetical protein
VSALIAAGVEEKTIREEGGRENKSGLPKRQDRQSGTGRSFDDRSETASPLFPTLL